MLPEKSDRKIRDNVFGFYVLVLSAILILREREEKHPLAVIENAPVKFTDKKINRKELRIKPKNDIYRVFV